MTHINQVTGLWLFDAGAGEHLNSRLEADCALAILAWLKRPLRAEGIRSADRPGATADRIKRCIPMDREVLRQAEPAAEILTVDIPDDALERAASAGPNALTWIPCTHLPYDCGWPL